MQSEFIVANSALSWSRLRFESGTIHYHQLETHRHQVMGCCDRLYGRCSNRRYVSYIVKGLFVRFCFLVYIIACMFMLSVYASFRMDLFAVGASFAVLSILLLIIEAFVTLCFSDKGEWRRYVYEYLFPFERWWNLFIPIWCPSVIQNHYYKWYY